MALNPQILGLLSQAGVAGTVGPLASILAQGGASPPTSIAPQGAPFPVPRPGVSGLVPSAAAPVVAPQPTPKPAQPAREVVAGTPAGINPLEALAPVVANPAGQAPSAGRPGLGGQINPQLMQLILQQLSAGQQPTQAPQSLGAILGQLR